jgi:calcineurin-like phosphoesterase family protein
MGFTRKFYVSDTHFGHEMILGHCQRPFGSVREMDEYMISRWNETVGESDIVYHLGDFGLCSPEYAKQVFSRLNGRKFLVLGNHDCRRGPSAPLAHIMEMGWEQPPTETLEVKDEGNRVFLGHYAHLSWQCAHRETGYHFYGHSHGNLPHPHPRARDVGVDMPDVAFTPRTFKELVSAMPLKAAA